MTGADDPHGRVDHIIRVNGPDLLRYFLRRSSNPEDAADMLNITFLVVWRRRTSLPAEDQNARLWCFGIARNVLREHRRTVARSTALTQKLAAELEHIKQLSSHADPALAAERGEVSDLVRSALSSLDQLSRELVMLVHWDEFSISEAARVLQMNESTARTRYARAREKLSAVLEPLLPDRCSREPSFRS